jgi:hypothetical protein
VIKTSTTAASTASHHASANATTTMVATTARTKIVNRIRSTTDHASGRTSFTRKPANETYIPGLGPAQAGQSGAAAAQKMTAAAPARVEVP